MPCNFPGGCSERHNGDSGERRKGATVRDTAEMTTQYERPRGVVKATEGAPGAVKDGEGGAPCKRPGGARSKGVQ